MYLTNVREEKGYGEDELDFRIVDLGLSAMDIKCDWFICLILTAKGENFSPTYLRLNINGQLDDGLLYSFLSLYRDCSNSRGPDRDHIVQ